MYVIIHTNRDRDIPLILIIQDKGLWICYQLKLDIKTTLIEIEAFYSFKPFNMW